MNRSRSFNRFHRYLARQKRQGLKAVLHQSNSLEKTIKSSVNQRQVKRDHLSDQVIVMELLESQA
jgi:hypothetical protein